MNEYHVFLDRLKQEFENHSVSMDDYDQSVFPLVVKWKWATEPQFYLEQLKVKRDRIPKGRILKNEPEDKSGCFQLGYDKDDNLIYEENWGSHPTHGYKKYFIYTDSIIYSYQYERRNGLLNILEVQERKDNKPEWFGSYAELRVKSVEKYSYSEGRLNEIQTLREYSANDFQSPLYKIEYDTFGAEKSITRIDLPSTFFPQGQNMVVYKNSAYSLKKLSDIILEEASQLIVGILQEKRDNPISALAIYMEYPFNSPDHWFPPKISYLAEKIELSEDSIVSDIMNLKEFREHSLRLKSEVLDEASSLFEQKCEMDEKYELPDTLLEKIAKKVKLWIKENPSVIHINENLMLLPISFPDDYETPMLTVLKRVYGSKEIKKM